MRESRTRDALRELGWGKSKASCYCALVQYGEMKASEIANRTGLRQEKVYNPLRRLENDGYAVLTKSDPKHYRAQNPRYVIDQERERFKEDTDSILGELEEAWARAEEGIPTTGDYAHVLSGQGGLRTARSEIIDEANESLYIFDRNFAKASPQDIERLEALIEDGADIKIVARESDRLTYIGESGADIRHGNDINKPTHYIADESRVMLNVSNSRATIIFEDKYFARIITSEFEDVYQDASTSDNETPS